MQAGVFPYVILDRLFRALKGSILGKKLVRCSLRLMTDIILLVI
jgi:hypothetical protein